jgi:hypothetical protein
VPRLYLIFIDLYSLLIALSPTIEICVVLEPPDISSIGRVGLELCITRCIDEIDCESELMLAVSRRSTEWVATSPEIPQTLLICRTPISTDSDEWYSELELKTFGHLPQSVSGYFSELRATTSLVNQSSRNRYEIGWCIWSVR